MSEILIQQIGKPGVTEYSDDRLTISIPIEIKRRSGRKQITLPNGELFDRSLSHKATPLQLALARGYRWSKMLESGAVMSLKAIAELEQIDDSYVSRMVNLTTLAPDIVAAILNKNLPDSLTLFNLAVDPPVIWDEQKSAYILP